MSAAASAVLTRTVGAVERSLQALFHTVLDPAGVSFAEWTAMVFAQAGPIRVEQLREFHRSRHIVGHADETDAAVRRLLAIEAIDFVVNLDPDIPDSAAITLSPSGRELFDGLRQSVVRITDTLTKDVPAADLTVTNRVLQEVGARAAKLHASV